MAVIAERQFEIACSGGKNVARVFVHNPERAEGGEWTCRYDMEGFSKSRAGNAHGEDLYQALFLAMRIIATEIAMTDEYKSGDLQLFGEASFDIKIAMGFEP